MNQVLCCLFSKCDFWNIAIGFVLSILLTLVWTVILFKYLFKPKLKIETPIYDKEKIIFKLVNNSNKRIVRIIVEACIVQLSSIDITKTFTYHYKFLENEFVLLPPLKENPRSDSHERYFKTNSFSEQTIIECLDLANKSLIWLLEKEDTYLRIRIHASHENSGFGKAFEEKFNWDSTNNKFVPFK